MFQAAVKLVLLVRWNPHVTGQLVPWQKEGATAISELFLTRPTASRPPPQEGYAAAELQNPRWIWSLTDSDPGCGTPGKFLDLSEPLFLHLQNGRQELKHYTTVKSLFLFPRLCK